MIVPTYVKKTLKAMQDKGFEAYIVGGCVRDVLMAKTPNDWDITTNARPEEVLKIFPEAKYENEFGTVLLPIKVDKNKHEKVVTVIEVTTYRSEQGYSNRRHPDEVKFETELEKDLERRDFTINALAQDKDGRIVDLFGGQKDIKQKVIRAVGEPENRFKEDALRMLRAIRLSCQLNFDIEPKTERAIKKLAGGIKFISNERIRDEFIKTFKTEHPDQGITKFRENKLLQYILPEIENTVGVKQDRHHIYTVFKHSLLSLKYCPSQDWRVKIAAFLHDIGKPKTKKFRQGIATFYNHEYTGAKMAEKILKRLKFSNQDKDKIVTLIKAHMFYYNVGEVTASSVRRLINKVGEENLKDLIDVRIGDRLGSGVPKGEPYKLRHLQYMMKKVRHDPTSLKMLKISGGNLQKELKIKPGPKIGAILDILLSEVIENPKLNTKKYLLSRAKELKKENLETLRKQAKQVIDQQLQEEDKELKREFKV